MMARLVCAGVMLVCAGAVGMMAAITPTTWLWAAAAGLAISGAGLMVVEGLDMKLASMRDLAPVPMVLHCPACALQHIDAPDTNYDPHYEGHLIWDNPPHRSHLCAGCGFTWRPADVPTTGVRAINTAGVADSVTRPGAAVGYHRQCLATLLDIWDDGKLPDEQRTYVPGALGEIFEEARTLLMRSDREL